jgi:ATP-dependent helicase HrpB
VSAVDGGTSGAGPDRGSAGPLPVDAVLDRLIDALGTHGIAVLEAPPGAGKTTRVPLVLLRGGITGRIVVLEPRRVAARAAAGRLAEQLGEPVGRTVGLTTRDERRTSRATRIEVVTDGVVLRRLQRDPSL